MRGAVHKIAHTFMPPPTRKKRMVKRSNSKFYRSKISEMSKYCLKYMSKEKVDRLVSIYKAQVDSDHPPEINQKMEGDCSEP